MTTNVEVLEKMFRTFWDYLTQAPDFVALGVKKFSQVDGTLLPVLSDNSIPATALPTFYVERFVPTSPRGDRDDAARQRIKAFEVHCSFIYANPTVAQAHAGFRALAAAMTAEDILNTESARLGGLAGSDGVDDFYFTPGECEAVPSVSNSQIVVLWVSRFTVTLEKQITYAAA